MNIPAVLSAPLSPHKIRRSVPSTDASVLKETTKRKTTPKKKTSEDVRRKLAKAREAKKKKARQSS